MTDKAGGIRPDSRAACAGLLAGESQLVYTQRVADQETPVSAARKLLQPGEPGFLLESVLGGERRGRYSIIGLMPDLRWSCRDGAVTLTRGLNNKNPQTETPDLPPLESLRALVDACQCETDPALPPMAGGLIGYLGYDMVKQMERLPDTLPDQTGIADAVMMRPGLWLVFDAVTDRLTLIAPIWKDQLTSGSAREAEKLYDAACERIRVALERLRQPLPAHHVGLPSELPDMAEPESNMSREDFHAMVLKGKQYIMAGDVFQVVLSQRFRRPFTLPPFALYRSLRHLNPSPFLFYLDMGEGTLVGSSPEILVRVRDGKVTIRPIAGTRPRGRNDAEDEALARELLADPKEIAEHLMLLDLGRNDTGRVARPHTVTLTERMTVERYSHVMHIVSNVEGELTPGLSTVDALVAGFPAGTVSGAPKIRAMEIIEELEAEKRAFYAGAVGYFSTNGNMDSCIALRTALVKDGVLHVQAGGGIVADSDPEAEYQESRNKARALLRAADLTPYFVEQT